MLHAADVSESTHGARTEARAATRDSRLSQIIAAILYEAIVLAIVFSLVRLPSASKIAVAYASLAPQLLIVVWSLRLSRRPAMWTFLIYGAFGILLVSGLAEDAIQTWVWASAFALLIILAIAVLFLDWVEGFIGEQLHIHLVQLAFTAYFELWAFLSDAFFATRGAFVLALACSIVTQHVMLFRVRARRRRIAGKRLLLLRAFAGLDERQDLLDDLRDTWQRVGTIELFAGPDVATRTMRPVLAAFLMRHSREHVLGSKEDVDQRLAQLDVEIESDARYPLNPIYASKEVWQHTFPLLEKTADVVLMDLRGFTMQNTGCRWELEHLRDHRKLRRIVFLIDENTDLPALDTLLGGREIEVLGYGHRSIGERRALFDLLLKAAYA